MRGTFGDALDVLTEAPHGEHPALLRERFALETLLDRTSAPDLLQRLAATGEAADVAAARAFRTIGLLGEGRVPEARAAFAGVPELLQESAPAVLRDYLDPVASAVWSAYLLDDFRAGIDLGERGLRIARRHGRGHVTANMGAALAYCPVNAGRLTEADAIAQQAIVDARRHGSQGVQSMALTALVQSAQWQRNDRLVAARYRALLAEDLPEAGWWRRTSLTAQARCAALLGEDSPGLPDTLQHDASVGYRYADAGLVHARSGDAGAAVRVIFTDLGMPAHLGRVHGGFARLDAATDPLHALTRREREVALFVADGLTNIQIADRLVISRRTVEEHVSKILRKLGVRSRVAVVGLVRGRTPD